MTVYEDYVNKFKHVAELLSKEGMTATEIANIFLTYVTRMELRWQRK